MRGTEGALPGDQQGGPLGSLTSPGRGAGPALRVRTKKPAAWWEAVGGQVPEQQSHPRETEASAQGGSAGVGHSADQGAGWAAAALHTWARLGEGCGGRRSPGGGGWGLSFPRQEVVRKLGVLSREGGRVGLRGGLTKAACWAWRCGRQSRAWPFPLGPLSTNPHLAPSVPPHWRLARPSPTAAPSVPQLHCPAMCPLFREGGSGAS